MTNQKVYKPWGSYEVLDAGEWLQVKRIMVNPGEALSLQLQHQVLLSNILITQIEIMLEESTRVEPLSAVGPALREEEQDVKGNDAF